MATKTFGDLPVTTDSGFVLGAYTIPLWNRVTNHAYQIPVASLIDPSLVVAAVAAAGNVVTEVSALGPITTSGGPTPTIGLTIPLDIVYGGTGTTTPGLIPGDNVAISGDWPNQTVSATVTGGDGSGVASVIATAPLTSSGGTTPTIAMTTPLDISYGGTGSATQNFVDLTSDQTKAGVLTFSSPPVFSGASIGYGTIPNAALVTAPLTGLTAGTGISVGTGTTPSVALSAPVAVANGGTGTASPSLVAGSNITISGSWPNQTINATGGGSTVAGGTGTITSVAASVTSVTLHAANASRLGVIITNDSTATLYIAFAASATTSAYTVKLAPGGVYESDASLYTGIITGIWDSATGNARVTEITA